MKSSGRSSQIQWVYPDPKGSLLLQDPREEKAVAGSIFSPSMERREKCARLCSKTLWAFVIHGLIAPCLKFPWVFRTFEASAISWGQWADEAYSVVICSFRLRYMLLSDGDFCFWLHVWLKYIKCQYLLNYFGVFEQMLCIKTFNVTFNIFLV